MLTKSSPVSARLHAVSVPSIEKPLSRESTTELISDNATDITVSLFENHIPDFVEHELLRLYAHYYSCLSHMQSEDKLRGASTFVEYRGRQVISLLLFRRQADTVVVLNEVIALPADVIQRFALYLFRKFPEVSVIQFRAIQTELASLSLAHLQFNYLEDIVISLPSTEEKFQASIGKNMRRNLRRYEKKFETLYPAARIVFSTDQEIDSTDLRQVVALNHERMRLKNKKSLISEQETRILEQEMRKSGLMCVVKLEGKVIAGALCFRTGANYFLTVIAHDSLYDSCSLGTLCCTHMISECVQRGGREFHFLWGRYDYKYLLGGVQHDLDRILLFRSHFAMLAHSFAIAPMWISARKRQALLYVHRLKKERPAFARIIERLGTLFRPA